MKRITDWLLESPLTPILIYIAGALALPWVFKVYFAYFCFVVGVKGQ